MTPRAHLITPRLRPLTTLVLALAVLAGCRACSEKDELPLSSSGALRRQQSERARLMARLNARKLDRDKVYPKDADGNVLCGADVDCFVLQTEHCTKASLGYVLTLRSFGVTQRIQGRYRIKGKGSEGDRCLVERDVIAVDARVEDVAVEALRKQGKQDEDIERMESQAISNLFKRYPTRLECTFTLDQALEVGLNLAEGRYDVGPWKDACHDLGGPPPRVGLVDAGAAEPKAEAASASATAKQAPAAEGAQTAARPQSNSGKPSDPK